MVDYRIEITMDFLEGFQKRFWFDLGKHIRKLKRRKLYLRRYWRRGERMRKRK